MSFELKQAVVAGILRNGRGEVLIQQIPQGKRAAGLWELPGGKVEPGETLDEAIMREWKEELGINIRPTAYLTTVTCGVEDAAGWLLHFHRVEQGEWHGARWLRFEPHGIQPKEGQKIAWVSAEDLPGYNFVPNDMAIILHELGGV